MDKIRLKQKQYLEDYDRFLKNIAKLRDDLKQFYPDMPDILLDIIHDYAKSLFYQMWETANSQEKISYKREDIKFLMEVNEDTNPNSLSGSSNALPQKTPKYIEASNT